MQLLNDIVWKQSKSQVKHKPTNYPKPRHFPAQIRALIHGMIGGFMSKLQENVTMRKFHFIDKLCCLKYIVYVNKV